MVILPNKKLKCAAKRHMGSRMFIDTERAGGAYIVFDVCAINKRG